MSKKNWVGHFHGSNKSFEEKTGYTHNTAVDESIRSIIHKILKTGLNVMVLQYEHQNVIFIDDGRFQQR